MKRRLTQTLLAAGLAGLAATAPADLLSVNATDTVATVLTAQAGKRVSVKLRSGEELTGTVGTVGDTVVHLRELTGREFFDATVALEAIDAVVVRTRDR